jgi:hypothetical protein
LNRWKGYLSLLRKKIKKFTTFVTFIKVLTYNES